MAGADEDREPQPESVESGLSPLVSPLREIRVLDLTQGVAGPSCTQHLADAGADVIKVEPPVGDWSRTLGAADRKGMTGSFISVNRGKRSICLDVKTPQGASILQQLAKKADVVIEAFRPGVIEKLGLSFEALRSQDPRLIWCSVSGYGRSGPNVELPATDSTMQAYGGLMSINGPPGGEPMRIGNVVSDMLAGMNAYSGILLALLQRKIDGRGRRVDVSLLDSMVAFQSPPLVEYFETGRLPQRVGNQHPLSGAAGVYRTQDGTISLTVMERKWKRFCEGVGLDSLLGDERFATSGDRLKNSEALRAILASHIATHTTQQWLDCLRGLDLNCAPIHDYAELSRDPQVLHNELIRTVTNSSRSMKVIDQPVRIDGWHNRMTAPPRKGEHSEQILTEVLSLERSAIAALFDQRVIY
jgi:crotonobetainyl-CoA:carnitine CoA-transferase CaiB-like acyl-CoA transferase